MGKQNFHGSMKTFFGPVTDKVKQTAQETIGAVKDTTKAIEQRGEATEHLIIQQTLICEN